MQLKLHPYKLLLDEPFTISRETYSERKTLIVELIEGNNRGFGEASEHRYYSITQENLMQRAESLRPLIESYQFDHPNKFHQFLQKELSDFPFLQCAFDNAAHDLYGQIRGEACHQLWGVNNAFYPKSSYTLSIAPIEKMVEKVQSNQFAIYKVKLGTDHDLEIIRALRKNSNAIFRVDANCAWTAKETIKNSHELKELGVEFIEQPLQANDWAGMKEVYQHSALPIIADEACLNEKDVDLASGHFHGINIKLMKCGGLSTALKMIERARSLGLKVMCGCMVESSVGIAAIAQLLPLLDYVDMDGPLFLTNDPAESAKIQADGSIVFPEGNGLGISMKKN